MIYIKTKIEESDHYLSQCGEMLAFVPKKNYARLTDFGEGGVNISKVIEFKDILSFSINDEDGNEIALFVKQ